VMIARTKNVPKTAMRMEYANSAYAIAPLNFLVLLADILSALKTAAETDSV